MCLKTDLPLKIGDYFKKDFLSKKYQDSPKRKSYIFLRSIFKYVLIKNRGLCMELLNEKDGHRGPLLKNSGLFKISRKNVKNNRKSCIF